MKRCKMFPDDPYDLQEILNELKNKYYMFNWEIRHIKYEFMNIKKEYDEIYLSLPIDINIRISVTSTSNKYYEYNCIHYHLGSLSNNLFIGLVVSKDSLFRLLKYDLNKLDVFKKPKQLRLLEDY